MRDRTALALATATSGAACAAGIVWHVAAEIALASAAVATVLVGVAAGILRRAVAHRRVTRGHLEAATVEQLAGTTVHVGPYRGAFVGGLWRPHIFVGREVAGRLREDELRAVVLHERAHQRARDPLRILALETLAPWLARTRIGAEWVTVQLASREIAADRFAIEQGASREAIASALLEVPAAEPATAGFTSVVDLRLRALLDGELPSTRSSRWVAVTAGVTLGLASCWSVTHLLLA